MVGIIDYGIGNLKSVFNSLKAIGADCFISSEKDELAKAHRLILPGVGAFGDAMEHLIESGLDQVIYDAMKANKPLLGICLGMQLLFDKSHENGSWKGLGLLKGQVVAMKVNRKVPHMGWNDLRITKEKPLLVGLGEKPYVYFVHSYHIKTDEDIISANVDYDLEIPVAVQKDNIFGVQFHPEKSDEVGLKILENFIKI